MELVGRLGETVLKGFPPGVGMGSKVVVWANTIVCTPWPSQEHLTCRKGRGRKLRLEEYTQTVSRRQDVSSSRP